MTDRHAGQLPLPTGPTRLGPPVAHNPAPGDRRRPLGRLPAHVIRKTTWPGITPSESAVWRFLASSENPRTGQCNPSLPTIARHVASSVPTVQRAIRALERKHLLVRHASGSVRHRGTLSNCYEVLLPEADLALPPPSHSDHPPWSQ